MTTIRPLLASSLAALATLWATLLASPAAAQPAPAAAAHTVPDTIAQRVAACTACHGQEGRATNHGYFPRIAGKPAGYLYNQLVHFRDGQRHYALMTHLLAHLTDAYLLEIATYYAGLDVPYPAPQVTRAPAALLERGRQLVLEGDRARGIPACAACHGAALTGMQPAVPGLLGLPRDYLNAQVGAWKTGQRRATQPDCMAEIAAKLLPQDIEAASTWLASQPMPAGNKPLAAGSLKLPLPCGSALESHGAAHGATAANATPGGAK